MCIDVTDVCIILPTFNEQEVIGLVIKDICETMNDFSGSWKILVVDDSSDRTPEILTQLQRRYPKVCVIHRDPEYRTGLSSAILLGVQAANSSYVQLMDADGQHPAKSVRKMIEMGITQNLDIVFSTRYSECGKSVGLESRSRKLYSSVLRWLPRLLFPAKVFKVSDPLAGFLLVKPSVLDFKRIRAIGWKMGLEFLIFSETERMAEMSYTFENRIGGKSKANFKVGVDYFHQLASLLWRYYVIKEQ